MEMKLYEKIGIRQWKKFILWLKAQKIRNPENRKGGSYYLEEINLNAVRKFKKQLLHNGLVHLFGLLLNIGIIIITILLNDFIFLTLYNTGLLLVNLYCIILQRYNWIRIKNLLKKVTRK